MKKALKLTKIFFFFVWSLVGFFVLLFFMGLFILNPLGRVEQGLKQLERLNQNSPLKSAGEMNNQSTTSSNLPHVIDEKIMSCIASRLGEKRFLEITQKPESATVLDQQKITSCLTIGSSGVPFGVTGFTANIVSPIPTK